MGIGITLVRTQLDKHIEKTLPKIQIYIYIPLVEKLVMFDEGYKVIRFILTIPPI